MKESVENEVVKKLIADIKTGDDQLRTTAWFNAGKIGASAVKPLAQVMTEAKLEVARAAKNGLWKITRYVGRPGASAEKEAVLTELIAVLKTVSNVAVKREVLWMLSEIGSDESVAPIVSWLAHKELREDARMALERIPCQKSLAALKTALSTAGDDFRLNIAQSLRQRGVKVEGHPCVKRVPSKETRVEPVR